MTHTNHQNTNSKTETAGLCPAPRSSSVPVCEIQNQTPKTGFWATVKTAFAWGLGGGIGGSIGVAIGQTIVKIFTKTFKWIGAGIASWALLHGIHSATDINGAMQHYATPSAQHAQR